jgi:hypothetical protein
VYLPPTWHRWRCPLGSNTETVKQRWNALASLMTFMAGAALLAGCSSSPTVSAPARIISWPSSGPGGCGTTVPSSIPPPGSFIGIRGLAKTGVSGPELLSAIPNDTIALWCVKQVGVYTLVHPPTISATFLPNASSADIRAAHDYFNRTGLFSRLVDCPHRYPQSTSELCTFTPRA